MNLINRIILPLSASLLLSLVWVPQALAQTDTTEADTLELEGKDAETQRFEADLRTSSQAMRYPLQDNVIASQVYIFQVSGPEYRQAIWEELEKSKAQLQEQQQREAADAAELQDMPKDEMDAETLRYKTAVEQLNLPPSAIKDLVEMFQANDAPMRELLWQRVEEAR